MSFVARAGLVFNDADDDDDEICFVIDERLLSTGGLTIDLVEWVRDDEDVLVELIWLEDEEDERTGSPAAVGSSRSAKRSQ